MTSPPCPLAPTIVAADDADTDVTLGPVALGADAEADTAGDASFAGVVVVAVVARGALSCAAASGRSKVEASRSWGGPRHHGLPRAEDAGRWSPRLASRNRILRPTGYHLARDRVRPGGPTEATLPGRVL